MSLFDQMLVVQSLPAAARTDGTDNGTAVDRGVNGGMQDAMVIVYTTTVTDGSHVVSVEESADGSTGWAEVTQVQGTAPTIVAANDDVIFQFGVRPTEQYLRVVVTTTGSTTGGIIGASIALNSPRFSPVSHS